MLPGWAAFGAHRRVTPMYVNDTSSCHILMSTDMDGGWLYDFPTVDRNAIQSVRYMRRHFFLIYDRRFCAGQLAFKFYRVDFYFICSRVSSKIAV